MFADKIYLLLLLLIPALVVFFYFVYNKRKKTLALFISDENISVLSNVKLKGYAVRYFLLILAFLFLILALARPQYGEQKQEVVKESSEIVIALDVSKSMLAQDTSPNRLERAKMMLLRVVDDNPGEKAGVIVFSGSAMWQCPMTFDTNALKMFLQGVKPGQLPLGGTQISDAILLAVKAVSESPGNTKVLLLISDGEDHDSKIKEAIAKAKETNLKIISVGIGTLAGAPIPVQDESGSVKNYVKDKNAQIVMSKMNPSLLKSIADETGGKYFDASDKDISPALIKAVKDIEKIKSETEQTSNKADRFQIFLLISLIFFIASAIVPTVRKA